MTHSPELLVISDTSPVFAIEDVAKTDVRLARWRVTVCHSLISALHIAHDRLAAGQAITGLVSAAELMDGRGDTAFWLVAALHPQVRGRTLIVATRPEQLGLFHRVEAVEVIHAPDTAVQLWDVVCGFMHAGRRRTPTGPQRPVS